MSSEIGFSEIKNDSGGAIGYCSGVHSFDIQQRLYFGNRFDLRGDYSCSVEVQRVIPFLKKAYGDSMHKVLHVGPDTCSVVYKLLKEEETEAWGVEPYDIEDAEATCKSLVHKGIVRVADIKFPLPYRPKSFSLVIVSDALDYLSPRYLNKTLPELTRVASDGLVVFTGYPGNQRAKVAELSKFGRPFQLWSLFLNYLLAVTLLCQVGFSIDIAVSFVKAKMRGSSWWVRFFLQNSLEENEGAIKKFEQAASKGSYHPACQVFHLKPYQ
ncbi:hypothetical protein Gohar_013497 [Gossypium harknessii]|uniref:Uncharacterized protein n=1 Tax=Gossypium harknessii TaxID=34285 RepID=A0A7J9H096_9ROSI|nr:hypothetical protein [Gossypium harknessii]